METTKSEQSKFYLSPEVKRAIRVLAAEDGRHHSEIVETALRKYKPIAAKLTNGASK